MNCSNCGSEIPAGANVCTQCGTPVAGAQPQVGAKKGFKPNIIGAVGAAIFIIALFIPMISVAGEGVSIFKFSKILDMFSNSNIFLYFLIIGLVALGFSLANIKVPVIVAGAFAILYSLYAILITWIASAIGASVGFGAILVLGGAITILVGGIKGKRR